MRDFSAFEDYAANFEGGDADPSLIYWTPMLLERWPNAKFVVIERDADQSLAAMVAASPPEMADMVRANWNGCIGAFSRTRDLLRDNPNVLFVEFDQLSSSIAVAGIVQHVGGTIPALGLVDRWQRLRVTSEIVAPQHVQAPRVPALPDNRILAREICDVSGLAAEAFDQRDFVMVSEWWDSHVSTPLHQAMLPPLGVMVYKNGKPVAAMWCLECFGVPTAELVYPVTRPGLSARDARRVIAYAASCLIYAAGKGHEPEAEFRVFKALVPTGAARFMERLGFRHALTDRKPMTLTL